MTSWVTGATVQAYIGADKVTLDEANVLAADATDAVRSVIQRDLTLQTGITDTVETNNTNFVLLHYWPIRAIASVSLNGRAMVAAATNQPGWRIDPVNPRKVEFAGYGRLGRGSMNVIVSGLTAGYDVTADPGGPYALPGHIRRALLLTALAFFTATAADPNLVAESTGGVFSGSFQPAGVGAVPPGAMSLLRSEMPVAP